MTATWRSRLLALAAILIGLLLATLLAELTLRIFHLASTEGLATVGQRDFDRLPGLFAPEQRVVDRDVPQIPYRISIDSLGYRGTTEPPRIKPAGEVRIVMLGDSFTFGYLVDDDGTLPAQVERGLQSRCGPSVRVINAGVGGTSIETAAPMMARAEVLKPDAAVLTFTENDVTDLAQPMWDQLAANRLAKSRFPMSVVYPLVREMALWNLMLKVRARWKSGPLVGMPAARPAQPPAEGESAAQRRDSLLLALRTQYRERLGQLKERLDSAGIPLILAIYPSHLAVYQGRDEQVRWVEMLATELGIRTVNLLAPLRDDGRTQEQLYLLPVDGHPSVAGYTVVAPAIAASLRALPVFAGRCTGP